MMPRFSFWNESYRFAPNSKFSQPEKIKKCMSKLSCHEKSRRVCSQNEAILVAKVYSNPWLTA